MIGLLVCEAGRGKLLDKQQNKSFTESNIAIYHVVAVWPALHAGLDAVTDFFVSLHRNRPPTTRHSSGNTYWSMRLLFLYFRNVQRSHSKLNSSSCTLGRHSCRSGKVSNSRFSQKLLPDRMHRKMNIP